MRRGIQGAEESLVLALLQNPARSSCVEIKALVSGIDWGLFRRKCPPPLHAYLLHAIERRPELQIPEQARVAFRSAREAGAVLAVRRSRMIRRTLCALANANIPVIVLKGAALAETVYPEPGLRYTQDIDILVHAEQVSVAAEALLAKGLRYRRPAEDISPWNEGDEFQMIDSSSQYPILLEVHGRIKAPVLTEREELEWWGRALPTQVAGGPASVLEPHDLLIHHCVHLAVNHWFEHSLLWLLDLRLLLESLDGVLDWNLLAKRAIDSGAPRGVYAAMQLAYKLLCAPVPETFFAAFPERFDSAELYGLALEQIWSPGVQRVPLVGLMKVLAGGSWMDGGRYVTQRIRGWTSRRSTPGSDGRVTLGTMTRRAAADLGVHLQTYRTRAREGSLSRANLRLFLQQWKRRKRLAALLAE